jgi:hypothetical protein
MSSKTLTSAMNDAQAASITAHAQAQFFLLALLVQKYKYYKHPECHAGCFSHS